MQKITLFLIIFPYLGISMLPSDIQPFAILFSIISIVLYRYRISLTVIFLFLLSLLFFLLASLNRLAEIDDTNFIDLIRYSFGVITPFVIYIVVYNLNLNNKDIASVLDAVLVLIAVGFLFNLLNLDFHKVLVSRADFDLEGNRGLVGFFPEPSRVSTHLVLMAMVYYAIDSLNYKRMIIMIILAIASLAGELFANVLILSSLYILFICTRFFFKLKISNYHSLFIISGVLIAPFMLIALSENLFLSNYRGFNILYRAYEDGLGGLSNDVGFLIKISGFMYGIGYIFDNLFNFMINSIGIYGPTESVVFLYSSIDASFIPIPQKLYSIFGVLVTDFGIIGLVFFVGLLFPLLLNLRSETIVLNIFIGFLIYLFFIRSFLPLTTFWLAYFLIIKRGNGLR